MSKTASFVILLILVSCSNYGQLNFITKLPAKLDENSGMVHLKDSTVWLINDSGGQDKIYQVNFKGELLKDFRVDNAKNKDWEDLARDSMGNVYIADFGNNNNKRKDLVIYKIPNPEIEKGDKIDAEKIRFSYPNQKKFPPKKEKLIYDAEALFYRDSSLYIINKNRSVPFTGETRIYKIPAEKGEHKAELVAKFITCGQSATCQITSADISPDGTKIVLLSYGKLWVYTEFTEDDFTKGKLEFINLGATTQLESVCFLNNNTLLLSDEQKAGTGRNLYTFTLE